MSSDDDNDFVGGFDENSLSPPPQFEPEATVNEELQALPEDDAQLEVNCFPVSNFLSLS